MNRSKAFILWFKDVGILDIPLVGGKNAALGEMYANLASLDISVPNGFTITASAYRYFLEATGLRATIKKLLTGLRIRDMRDLKRRGQAVRASILSAKLPADLGREIVEAYSRLGRSYSSQNPDVAVRSSATAEDLPDASFAGQQDTFLNVRGADSVLLSVKKCIASLFTDRAISYRADKGFSHFDIALSVGIQKMVRSDLGASGVAFTIDTETGFDNVVVINGSYGLGEMIVQGQVTPDEFILFKPSLNAGLSGIIGKSLGKKNVKLIYAPHGTRQVSVRGDEMRKFCLTDSEVSRLGRWCINIEKYFSKKHNRYQPMDIEWAKDGKTGKLFIVQARPETVHSIEDKRIYREYVLTSKGKVLLMGAAVGKRVASGPVKIIRDPKRITDFRKGEVLVTEMTDPDWEPIMKIATAIVTDKGGRTSHAAIVSRELGIPCIVGSGNATKVLRNGEQITIDCSSGETGIIYKGKLPFRINEHRLDKLPKTRTKIMVNIGSPDEAFKNHFLPAKGVGLGRLEFIIASHIKIHPNVLIDYDRRRASLPRSVAREIGKLTTGYKKTTEYYVDKLAEGIARIGAAFWPYEVIIRFSDFKTNEYNKLIGGELYEPKEENPMLGWRGASRYHDPKFKEAFGLECRALKRVRTEMGLKNVIPMIPFCRTPKEGREVLRIMAQYGLSKAKDKGLKTYVMCEIPSNVLLADEFLDIFDGMSIGSNDLTQLTLGLDRDSGIVAHIANENDQSVKKLIETVIERCRKRKKYIGICGQAPSDYPDFAAFLVRKGIESISLNPDTVVRNIMRIAQQEKALRKR